MGAITDQEFSQFQKLIYDIAGIHLSPAKKNLVIGRLAKRLHQYGLATYGDYFQLLTGKKYPHELQVAVDLLTTNETYFFREPKHFDFLRQKILPSHPRSKAFRVWSAACSSGQEPYTVGMVLAYTLGESPWEVVASDISTRVLERARSGHYPLEQAELIPREYLARFCLKGVGTQEGTFMIEKGVRNRVKFAQINLNESLPRMESMNLIFLRNVMIYFDADTKRKVVKQLTERLKPGGYFFVGHSESLNGINDELKSVAPAIYRKA